MFDSVFMKMNFLIPTMFLIAAASATDVEKIEKVQVKTWYLGMNLNPDDGHIMDYTTGWADNNFIGTYTDALKKDYLNRVVWGHPVSYIALVRHQAGEIDAVKVFRFKESTRSLLSRFQDMDPGREIVTEGGPIQESVGKTAQNLEDDPIFSVDGDLAFNWGHSNNGVRIALTGGHLSAVSVDDDNTHGLGNHYACTPTTGIENYPSWAHEIANIQDIETQAGRTTIQGGDHGDGWRYVSGPVYGNYAIYVSEEATSFPGPGNKLDIEVEVVPKYKFFQNE